MFEAFGSPDLVLPFVIEWFLQVKLNRGVNQQTSLWFASTKLRHILGFKSRLKQTLQVANAFGIRSMAIVSVTRLRLRSLRFLLGFIWYTRRSMRQAKGTPGNLGVRVRKTKGLAFWTLAIWRDNQAIRRFVPASPHKKPCRSCGTGAMKPPLPTGNKTRLIGRRGKRQLKDWLPRADWSRCCTIGRTQGSKN